MNRIRSLLLLVLLPLGLAFASPAFAALAGVVELKHSPEALPDSLIASLLDARVEQADVVALGETSHGSSGFLKLQTRLIRYLVTRHGFRLLAWENPTLRSLELARWAERCTSEITRAPLSVLYLPTASDRPLLEWICTFNHAHPKDPVIFRGIDIWDRPWEHYARIRELAPRLGIDAQAIQVVSQTCPAYQARSWSQIEGWFGEVQREGRFVPQAAYQTCVNTLERVLRAARDAAQTQRSPQGHGSAEAYELALSASTLIGWLGFYNDNWSDDILSWNARDRAQGRNLMLLTEKHRTPRAILAAHTSHVSHNRSPADWWGFGDIKSGVSFFEALTGKRVFNIAFTGYEVSGPQGYWSLPAAANSLDKRLHDAGHAFSFFPSDAAFLADHARWWMQNQNYPGPYESGVELVPGDHFDAFFFIDRSHVDETLPARPMWQP